MSDIDELLSLDNQLCFRLYASSRAVTRVYRPLLDKLELTYPQYLIMLALWQWESEGQADNKTLRDLGDRLQLDSGTMTPLFRRLLNRGLVKKSPSLRDGREMHISLTAEGLALKQQAAQVPKQLMCLLDNDEDRQKFLQLRTLLDDLMGILRIS